MEELEWWNIDKKNTVKPTESTDSFYSESQEKIEKINTEIKKTKLQQWQKADKLTEDLCTQKEENTETETLEQILTNPLLTEKYDRKFEKKLKSLTTKIDGNDKKNIDKLVEYLSGKTGNRYNYEILIENVFNTKEINDEEIINSCKSYIKEHIDSYKQGKYWKSIKNFLKILRWDAICFISNKNNNWVNSEQSANSEQSYILLEKRILNDDDKETLKKANPEINEDKPILQLHIDHDSNLNDIQNILKKTKELAEKLNVQPYVYACSWLLDEEIFNYYEKKHPEKNSNIIEFKNFCKKNSVNEKIILTEKLPKKQKTKFIKERTSLYDTLKNYEKRRQPRRRLKEWKCIIDLSKIE